MEEFNFYYIAQKSVKGFFALISRTFLVQILTTITGFILVAYLAPSDYGVFFIVSSMVVFLTYFQDIGLAASLIQKKENITLPELRTVFTVQQLLVLVFIIPALLFSSHIARFYTLSDDGYLLLVALLISFFISSLKTIPTVLLERNLDFGKLVIPQILENVSYNICLLYFAVGGYGVMSFTIAVAVRSIIGLVAIYAISPWKIGFALEKESLKKLLSFGVPFQAHSLLALVKDDLLNIYIGRVLPLSHVGYVGFAQKMAYTPLRLVMDNVIKITFPSFSRLQHDKQALGIAIEKSIFLISLVIFPAVAGMILTSPYFVRYISKYNQWEPALMSLSIFALTTLVSSIVTPITNFLNAIGKVKITLYFMVGWTIATWIFVPLFINLFGFNGVAYASLGITISSILAIFISRRYVRFSIISPLVPGMAATLIMIISFFILQHFITSLVSLMGIVIVLIVMYAGGVFLVARSEVSKTIGFMMKAIRG